MISCPLKTVLCRHNRFICPFLFQVYTFKVSVSVVRRVASLLHSFTRCEPTNQRAAHLYIHEHTIKGEKLVFSQGYFTGCIRAHWTAAGPLSDQPMLHTLFGDLNPCVIFRSLWPFSHCDPCCDNCTSYKNKVKHFLLTVGLSHTSHSANVKRKYFLFVFVLGKIVAAEWWVVVNLRVIVTRRQHKG